MLINDTKRKHRYQKPKICLRVHTLEEFGNDSIVIPSVIEPIDVTFKTLIKDQPAIPPIIMEDWSNSNKVITSTPHLNVMKERSKQAEATARNQNVSLR